MLLISSVFFSSALHLTFVFTHSIVEKTIITETTSEEPKCYRLLTQYSMHISPGAVYEFYEKVYYWAQLTLSIVVPTVVMLICSVLIVTRFTFKRTISREDRDDGS
uniref:G-protein coupled receptors family 1 profile domain-containing protein n=1 Tax=Parascaris equorum TaxID=6256 RepID=A0A914S3V3_PAREQ